MIASKPVDRKEVEASWSKGEFRHDRFSWKPIIQVYLSCVVLSLSLSFSPTFFFPICSLSVDLSLSCVVFLSFLLRSLCVFLFFFYVLFFLIFLNAAIHSVLHSDHLPYLCSCQAWAGFTWMAIFKYRPPLNIKVLSGLFESSVMGNWIDLYSGNL